jgi:hypothetical protein
MRTRSVVICTIFSLIAMSRLALGDGVVCHTDPLYSSIKTSHTPQTIAFYGDTAYIGTETSGLLIYDISDPAAPQSVGTFITLRPIAYATVHDGRLYMIGQGSAGVDILDLSDPHQPISLGFAPVAHPIKQLAFSGTTMYAMQNWDRILHTFDISDPKMPTSLSSIDIGTTGTFDYPQDIDVYNDYVYVLSRETGIRIFDSSNPAAPEQIGSYEIPHHSLEISITDGIAGVSTVYRSDVHSYTGLLLFDLSDPTSPTLIPQLAPQYKVTTGRILRASGSRLYLHGGRDRVEFYDIEDPERMSLVGGYRYYYISNRPNAMDVHADVLYVGTPSGFDLLATDSSIAVQGIAQFPDVEFPSIQHRLRVASGIAFVAGSSLRIIDVSDPKRPYARSEFPLEVYGNDVARVDNAAYVSTITDGVSVIDVTDPDNPTLIRKFRTSDSTYGLAAQSDDLYVLDGDDGLMIYRVTQPDGHWFRGSLDLGEGVPQRVHVDGDIAFVSTNIDGLLIIDVSDPTNPQLIGQSNPPGSTQAFSVQDSYAYVLSNGNLWVIDISDFSTPIAVGTLDLDDTMLSITTVGDYAYITTTAGEELLVVDISNPIFPTLVQSFRHFDLDSHQIASVGTTGYVIQNSSESRLQVIDLSSECSGLCNADLTGDGTLDVFDIFAFLDVFNAGDPAGDFNADGVFDVFDVFAYLDAFNAGCP